MNEKKNIDRLFQEKFKDFEAVPNDAVWNRISESLPKKKKKRRVIALWWQLGGVAAVIALLLTFGTSIFDADPVSNEDPAVVNTEKTDSEKENTNVTTKDNENLIKNNLEDLNDTPLVDTNESNSTLEEDREKESSVGNYHSNKLKSFDDSKQTKIANTSHKKENKTGTSNRDNLTTIVNKDNSTKIASSNTQNNDGSTLTGDDKIKSVLKETINNANTTVAQNTSSDNSDKETAITENPNKESILNAIADNSTNDINEKEKEDERNRWSIAPNVAPVYFSSLGQGSSIGAQFNQNAKSSDINMSYGITGSYAVTKKLKIRAGVNSVNLSQTTSDVLAFTGGEFASRGTQNTSVMGGNITPKNGLGNITLMSANVFNTSSSPEIFNTKIAGNIDQRFSFIEVPLELEYRLLDKKFGLNVIGGFSTLFLNQNEVYADIDGRSTLIGEANNINSTSFTANFGLGLDYSLSKQWNINLEPQFKYQLNTFNDTSGNFRPFFIGVYTGLSYKF